MKYEEAISRIDKYKDSDKHRPIIVDLPNVQVYNQLVQHYDVGNGNNTIIEASSFCTKDGMPAMDRLQHSLSSKDNILFLTGLSFYLKLQGKSVLQKTLRALLDMSCQGKLIIVTLNCSCVLRDMDTRLIESGRILLIDGDNILPVTLSFVKPKLATSVQAYIKGIDKICRLVKNPTGNDVVCITSKGKSDFPNSMYDIDEYSSEYQVLRDRYAELKNIDSSIGSEDQWAYLLKEIEDNTCESWDQYISRAFGETQNLAKAIGNFSDYDEMKRWAYFLALRINGVKENEYLSHVIGKSQTYDDFIKNSFEALLDFSVESRKFYSLYVERKRIVSKMEEYADELECFCKMVYAKQEHGIYYLTDNTKREKEMIIELIVKYHYPLETLRKVLPDIYDDLATYLKPFNYHNNYLNEYFEEYKYCKVTNCITDKIRAMVQDQSLKRQYNIWLQPRSLYVDKLKNYTTNTMLYFMDAMGVEFMSYMQEKCYKAGLEFQAEIARCNLPSITFFNKEFVTDFRNSGSKVCSIKKLDELKHGGVETYNYENTKLPLHIVEELEILNKLVLQLKTLQKEQSAYVVSDHGASRLAVINEKENKWEISEKGIHSGRCCPESDIEEKPIAATEENGFWCLANYDRFKGGRKAAVEVHGGATLEEVAVPVISIRKVNKQVNCKLADTKPVMVSFKKKAQLKLFVDVVSDALSVSVNGIYYSLVKTDVKYLYAAEMPKVKKAGVYKFNVYEDNKLIASDMEFEVKKEGTTERKFF